MLASEIVSALERGHITEAEAIEQSLVESIDSLYAKAGLDRRQACEERQQNPQADRKPPSAVSLLPRARL